MIRILFICHGNICRSPMAEFVMKDLAEKAGVADRFGIASAATSREEIQRDARTGRDVGSPVYPPAKKKLAEHGIDCGGKTARQLTKADYDYYDLLVCMDQWNVRNALRILGSDPDGKLKNLLDFAGRPGDEVADPWYTGDFEATWEDVLAGCRGLLEAVK
ncbi:MAG: low molecular weight phosphotyrosine protein phosphatase [Firmicutes bacterium]|nr:low molecular weight phosphotyrosine protein phosphatase [Bacillota bacterium]